MNEENTTNVVSGASHHRSSRSVLTPIAARPGPCTPDVPGAAFVDAIPTSVFSFALIGPCGAGHAGFRLWLLFLSGGSDAAPFQDAFSSFGQRGIDHVSNGHSPL
jgi:hypothetical protein